MEHRTDLDQLLKAVTEEYSVIVSDFLFSYEERILNCHVEDENEHEHVLYNEQDLTLDLYTIVEEYTDKFITSLEFVMEEKVNEITERMEDPLNCHEK